MSNALAIASVTAVLKDLLDNALIDHSVTAGAGGPVTVSAIAPDRIKDAAGQTVRLNLFLYHVAPNPGWRNVGLPSSNQSGERLTNPPLALDLYYLLTAYGQEDFEAEILLGYAMQVLHETPILPREAIRTALEAPSPVDTTMLPPALGALAASDLADQVELIKLTPQGMNSEEIYKLWGAFQTSYRPSVAYQASVVLIEGNRPARSPLPVLTRGQPNLVTGREAGVLVRANLQPPFPALQAVLPPHRQTAVRMGEMLACSGQELDGDQVRVLFRQTRTARTLELPASSGATATGFQVQIPPDPPAESVEDDSPLNPDNWQIGVYGVSAVIERAGEPDRITGELPLAVAPRVSVAVSVVDEDVTFTATVSPKVWKNQQARLLIADRQLPAEPIATDKSATLTFKAKTAEVPSGAQWIRLRVDGIDSILVDRSGALPQFDTTQQVTI